MRRVWSVRVGMLSLGIAFGLLFVAPSGASSQPQPTPPTAAPTGLVPSVQTEVSTDVMPSVTSTPPAVPSSQPGSGPTSSTPGAVVAGLVGGLSAILGVAITQLGAFRLSKNQRRSDRRSTQLDELRQSIEVLDGAYAAATGSDHASRESRDLDLAIRAYGRAWRMTSDSKIQRLAEGYHEKLKLYSVQGEDLDGLDEASVITRVDLDRSSHKLVDRIREVLDELD